jgi:hypothetical protein
MNANPRDTEYDARTKALAISYGTVFLVAIVLYVVAAIGLMFIERLSPAVHWSFLLLPAVVCGGVGYWLARRNKADAPQALLLVVFAAVVAPFIAMGIVQYGGYLWAVSSGKGV